MAMKKSMSDLRNYEDIVDIVENCSMNSPVYLIENGDVRAVIVHPVEYKKKTEVITEFFKQVGLSD